MRVCNWLHISDFHCGLNGQPPFWANLRDPFFDDLARLHEKCGPLHAVFFTGDLAQSGQDEEFAQLEEKVLAPLWDKLEQLGTRQAPLFTVPGNHDLMRPNALRPSAALRQLLRDDGFEEVATEFWDGPASEYRELINRAFENYLKWWRGSRPSTAANLKTGMLPGDFSATLRIPATDQTPQPLNVGIVGLNTAFLQLAGGDYRRRLVLNELQTHKICDDDIPRWVAKHDFAILLTHHGSDWLDDRSSQTAYSEINPAGRFAVHLFGHMHENLSRSVVVQGGKPLKQWQVASLFGMEKFGEPPRQIRSHGYAVGQIDASADPPMIRQWPRLAIGNANGWRFDRDINFVLDDDGATLPQALEGLFPAKPPAPGTTSRFSRRHLSASHRAAIERDSDSPALTKKASGRELLADDERVLSRYRDAICRIHGHIRFVEIPSFKDVSDVGLETLYVEPRLSAHDIRPTTLLNEWPTCVNVVDALRDHSHLVLLGDPGSGKSTLVSCISWQLSRTAPVPGNAWTNAFGGCIPLPMILRELRLAADVTWERLLDAFLEHRTGEQLQNRSLVESILKEGRAVVLLDGLDEIGSLQLRRRLRDVIHTGMTTYPESRWLLTSRIVGYDQVPFHIKSDIIASKTIVGGRSHPRQRRSKRVRIKIADLMYLAPFDDNQIRHFSRNWYAQHESESTVVESSAADFVHAIRENEGTQRLARIPYLLTLMALIHHKNLRLPHGRAELYDRIATAYLESIDLRRKLNHLPYSFGQKRRWLADVAYRMQLRRREGKAAPKDGDILVDRAEVQKWLRAAMKESNPTTTKEDSVDLLTYFARRSGLLLPRGETKFAFMHLSMQEYFAACFLEPRLTASRFVVKERKRNEPTDRQLRAWINSQAWRETFVLLFERLAEKSAAETEGFLEYLFGKRFANLANDPSGRNATAVDLLAELAVDPFVELSAETRQKMRERCWRWAFELRYFVSGNPSERGKKVINTLVSASGGDLGRALRTASISAGEIANVDDLNLSGCSTLSDLRPLMRFKRLSHLSLASCTSVSDLAPLASLKRLATLDLNGCTGVSDISPLASLNALSGLDLGGCENVRTIEPLSRSRALAVLTLGRPTDLSALGGISTLNELHLHYVRSATADISPLAALARLEYLCLGEMRAVNLVVSDKLRANPSLILSNAVRVAVMRLDAAKADG